MAKTPKQPKRAVKGPAATQWWAEAEEVPRAGLPDATKLSKKAKRLRILVWATVILMPFTLLALFISMAAVARNSAVVAPNASDEFADTRPDAVLAISDWLGQTPAPLPGGHVVAWESATEDKKVIDAKATNQGDPYMIEVHHVAVADGSGNLYDSAVSLAVSDSIGTVVVGKPSLIRLPSSDDHFDGSEWPNEDSVSVSEDMKNGIEKWATSFTSSTPSDINATMLDGNKDHSYVPLTDATLTDPKFGKAFGVWKSGETADVPNLVVVRVTFSLGWKFAPVDPDAALPTVTYDLLLKDAASGTPVVVAWGGPGSGPTLKPYGNAITTRTLEDPTPHETVTPDPTPTPVVTKTPQPPANQPANQSKPQNTTTGGVQR